MDNNKRKKEKNEFAKQKRSSIMNGGTEASEQKERRHRNWNDIRCCNDAKLPQKTLFLSNFFILSTENRYPDLRKKINKYKLLVGFLLVFDKISCTQGIRLKELITIRISYTNGGSSF